MARRASFSIHPGWILGVVLLIGAAIGAGYFVVGKVNDPYRTIPVLSVPAYLENSNSLRGNTYKVTGTIWSSLAWSPTVGRLFSVEVESPTGADVVPVLIPAELNHVNIQKGQRFIFKIEVDDQGILLAKELGKV